MSTNPSEVESGHIHDYPYAFVVRSDGTTYASPNMKVLRALPPKQRRRVISELREAMHDLAELFSDL